MYSLDLLHKRPFTKQRCYRLIPSQFPPIHLFEDVASPDEFDALFAVQMLTNPRIQDEIGLLNLVPKEERLYAVPGCGYIMAAFTHINPDGSRFSNGDYGVYYAAESLSTAIAETIYHKEQFLSFTNEPAQELDMRSLIADFSAQLFDLTALNKQTEPIYSLIDYKLSQNLGAQIKEKQEDGCVYHSVRSVGTNFALFKPNIIHKCHQGSHFSYVWNGEKITTVYKKENKNIALER
ncbi:RES family NAD+ phosphorylase [Legionella maioricensis]|uniref:RES family NAD+ phosphorylase n=1 Tax=Legionella maioricensis TaxID=2896528 RepID=A0A9X2ICU2_9GAMM|nr:RES family NAD+ phosphorylase [Legionella maioricensis]MCL9685551.1 RES family NAD+ phosphorylase [Legionella maioricensis]MCL9688889.1 RES family NAD+ phosphorylase [Legionella maioricensis]